MLVMHRHVFQQTVQAESIRDRKEIHSFLRGAQLFSRLGDRQLWRLADAVQQLHDSAGRRAGGVHVVDDRDPVCVDELGHGPSLGAARPPTFL